MADYDIGQAFKEIEDELIASMIRNLERHKAWEEEEGFQWDQWQSRQLQALERYRRLNQKKFKGEFKKISQAVDEAIRTAREDGRSTAEAEILQKIKDGFADYHKADPGVSQQFFRLNERKLNALIKATKKDFVKGEHAILRMANDQYRKVIYAAQMYANTGAGTYEKAVDMATRDFLQAGLNCVEYKNGARHTLHDYADMAIKTATTRAYLAGEGEMRNEWGIHTVIVNKRTAACSKCMPFAGKIMIDDVYANGSRKDGRYTLVSQAVEKGFLHPRCKDTYTTYFPGLDDNKAGEPSKADKKKAAEKEEAEAKQNHARLQAEKYDRMANGSLDPENQQMYEARAVEWGQKSEDSFVANSSESGHITHTAIEKDAKSIIEDIINPGDDKPIKWPKRGDRMGRQKAKQLRSYGQRKGIDLIGLADCDLPEASAKEIVDDAEQFLRNYPELNNGRPRISFTAQYMNSSRYFAGTTNHLISVNADAYRDLDRLEKEYQKLVEVHWFPQGTDHHALIAHEIGHVIHHRYPEIHPIEIAMKITGKKSRIELMEYISKHLSEYAAYYKNGQEIISECYACVLTGIDNEFALKFVQECDIIIKKRLEVL